MDGKLLHPLDFQCATRRDVYGTFTDIPGSNKYNKLYEQHQGEEVEGEGAEDYLAH